MDDRAITNRTASGQVLDFSRTSSTDSRLQPADRKAFAAEMVACLTLVAPAGMKDEARSEWLRVAHGTVGHLPLDLLRAGCEVARREADHPARIVPIIMRVADPLYRSRKEPDPYRVPRERHLAAPSNPTKDEVDAILRRFGHADVAAKISGKEERKAHRGPPRAPTPDELEQIRKEMGL